MNDEESSPMNHEDLYHAEIEAVTQEISDLKNDGTANRFEHRQLVQNMQEVFDTKRYELLDKLATVNKFNPDTPVHDMYVEVAKEALNSEEAAKAESSSIEILDIDEEEVVTVSAQTLFALHCEDILQRQIHIARKHNKKVIKHLQQELNQESEASSQAMTDRMNRLNQVSEEVMLQRDYLLETVQQLEDEIQILKRSRAPSNIPPPPPDSDYPMSPVRVKAAALLERVTPIQTPKILRDSLVWKVASEIKPLDEQEETRKSNAMRMSLAKARKSFTAQTATTRGRTPSFGSSSTASGGGNTMRRLSSTSHTSPSTGAGSKREGSFFQALPSSTALLGSVLGSPSGHDSVASAPSAASSKHHSDTSSPLAQFRTGSGEGKSVLEYLDALDLNQDDDTTMQKLSEEILS